MKITILPWEKQIGESDKQFNLFWNILNIIKNYREQSENVKKSELENNMQK
jgi:hypothetical protein